ncbi:hypothetical protein JCM11641_008244 [Rhodosporidiobolus odoratus]
MASSAPGTRKRVASLGSTSEFGASLAVDSARKRARGGQEREKDVVLVSADGHRISFSSRALSSNSAIWDTLLPSTFSTSLSLRQSNSPSPPILTPSASEGSTPAPTDLPEVHLPESGQCLSYVLGFLESKPVAPREVEFPRDWETIRALERYQIWRGIDQFTSSFSHTSLDPVHLAPAFLFSLLFHLPTLTRQLVHRIAKHVASGPDALQGVVEALERGKKEWEGVGEEGGVEKLLSYLLTRTLHLSILRTRALDALKAFDDRYDCEDGCKGIHYEHVASLLSTSSRKKVARMEGEVGFDCKDCDIRWDQVVQVVQEGLASLPNNPFTVDADGEEAAMVDE